MTSKSFYMHLDNAAHALDISPDGKQVVLCGRAIFKIFGIENDRFEEHENLRIGKQVNLNYACFDVVWNKCDENVLATGATNGAVVLWDLASAKQSKGKFINRVYFEHKRSVNKVHFNPLDKNLLLSGSQDGFVKLFDIRCAASVATFSINNQQGVRDVQFSPHNEGQFVSVSENGLAVIWDIRRSNREERSWLAHAENTFTCDWHPHIRHWMATAGRDKTIRVWKTEVKPVSSDSLISCIGPIGKIRWRPGRRAQIASCAIALDFAISVWDNRRPFIPFGVFENHKDITTSICWKGIHSDAILSTSRDGMVYHEVFRDADRPAERLNPLGLSLNVSGEIGMAFRNHDAEPISESSIDEQDVVPIITHVIPQAPPLPPYGVNIPITSGATATPVATSSMVQHQFKTASTSQPTQLSKKNFSHSELMRRFRRSNSDSPKRTKVEDDSVQRKPSLSGTFKIIRLEENPDFDEGFRATKSYFTLYEVPNKTEVKNMKIDPNNQSKLNIASNNLNNPNTAITSTDWFVISAENYCFTGKSLRELCDHNALVAKRLNRQHIASTWLTLKLFYNCFNFDEVVKSMKKTTVGPSNPNDLNDSMETGKIESGLRDGRNRRLSSKSGTIVNMDAAQNLLERRERNLSSRNFSQRSAVGAGTVASSATTPNPMNVDAGSNTGDSNSEDDDENDMTLTNIASGPQPASDRVPIDFFGENELTTVGIEQFVQPDPGLVMSKSGSNEWNIKSEAFEMKHELKETTDHDQAALEQLAATGIQEPVDILDERVKSVTVQDQTISLLKVSNVDIFPPWSPDETVKETLIHYAEIGDIQTTVSIYLVLGHERLKHLFNEDMVEYWFLGYIELLQRLRLFNTAALVIKHCPLQAVSELSLTSTMYFSNCTKCRKALSKSRCAWYCERCKAVPNLCSICHQCVRGLFVWCKECGHGGHVDHLRKWFKIRNSCPTGCGHECMDVLS